MDDRDRLAFYPFVVVRIACRVCSRNGAYRLARLAAKFGPEISLRDLLDRFSYDCLWRGGAWQARVSACGVYLPDFEQPRPPDTAPGLVRLRVVVSNEAPQNPHITRPLSWATVGTSSDHSAALRRGVGSALASCEMAPAPAGSRHPLISP